MFLVLDDLDRLLDKSLHLLIDLSLALLESVTRVLVKLFMVPINNIIIIITIMINSLT